MRRLIRPLKHRRLLGRVPPVSGFQHQAFGSDLGEDVGGRPSPGARAYNDGVIFLGVVDNLRHESLFR